MRSNYWTVSEKKQLRVKFSNQHLFPLSLFLYVIYNVHNWQFCVPFNVLCILRDEQEGRNGC